MCNPAYGAWFICDSISLVEVVLVTKNTIHFNTTIIVLYSYEYEDISITWVPFDQSIYEVNSFFSGILCKAHQSYFVL